DPDFWVGAQILMHTVGNAIVDSEIRRYDSSHHIIFYGNVGPPLRDANWDGKFHYAIVNSPRLISRSGQYAINVRTGIVYIWPRARPQAVTVGTLPFGFNTNGQSYVSFDGFVIQGQYGTSYVTGRGISGSNSTPTDGVLI